MSDLFFMQKALEQAIGAAEQDEVPVGAVLGAFGHGPRGACRRRRSSRA